jgi:4-oxalocrotonate tautomerase
VNAWRAAPSQSVTWRRAVPTGVPTPISISAPSPALYLAFDHRDAMGAARVTVNRRTLMPLIEVHLIEDVFDPAQKKQIIEKLTDAMVSIEGENMRGVTWVKISEVKSGEWGIGGQALTTEAVKALAAGKQAA